ncbi:cupin-2 domain-containing protein [Favolaschia claudopus]|uniref:Cupin-2 domain-containing protein n=1 Tax=Favolaschia claudopus TaxID=2862362 RepID=A0AAW0CCS6_9AGAR
MGDPLTDDTWSMGKGMTFSILQNPLRARLHSTGEEAFVVPAHWHATHDEHHTVLKGRLFVTQDGVRKEVRPEDGPLLTKRGVVHSLETVKGEETIIEEVTLQGDEITEQKHIFFRNLFAIGMPGSFLRVMQVFYYGDGYPELPFRSRWLERLLVVVAGGWIASWIGYELPDKRLRMDKTRFPPTKKVD